MTWRGPDARRRENRDRGDRSWASVHARVRVMVDSNREEVGEESKGTDKTLSVRDLMTIDKIKRLETYRREGVMSV